MYYLLYDKVAWSKHLVGKSLVGKSNFDKNVKKW